MIINRLRHIDILKGLGIIFVILGHMKSIGVFLHSFIYIFHMPLFFFISGVLHNPTKTNSSFIIRKFKRLMAPFLFWGLTPHLLFALKDYKISSLVSFFNSFIEESFFISPIWFLYVLFIVEVIYEYFYQYRTYLFPIVLIICSILFTYREIINLPLFIDTILISLLFYNLGSYGRFLVINELYVSYKWGIVLLIILTIHIINYNTIINYRSFIFGNISYIFLITAALFGIYCCYLCSIAISNNNLFSSFLCWLGRNTMFILCTHMILLQFIYKLYDLYLFNIYEYPIVCVCLSMLLLLVVYKITIPIINKLFPFIF